MTRAELSMATGAGASTQSAPHVHRARSHGSRSTALHPCAELRVRLCGIARVVPQRSISSCVCMPRGQGCMMGTNGGSCHRHALLRNAPADERGSRRPEAANHRGDRPQGRDVPRFRPARPLPPAALRAAGRPPPASPLRARFAVRVWPRSGRVRRIPALVPARPSPPDARFASRRARGALLADAGAPPSARRPAAHAGHRPHGPRASRATHPRCPARSPPALARPRTRPPPRRRGAGRPGGGSDSPPRARAPRPRGRHAPARPPCVFAHPLRWRPSARRALRG
jgi:hypothetical protein